jgi:hypothetical protein
MTTKVVHCKKEPYDVLIDRSTKWGNPFSHKQGTKARFIVGSREEAVNKYFEWLCDSEEGKALFRCIRSELKDKILGCWCKPLACHGDILRRIADADYIRDFCNYPVKLSQNAIKELKAVKSKKKKRSSCDYCDKGVPHGRCD